MVHTSQGEKFDTQKGPSIEKLVAKEGVDKLGYMGWMVDQGRDPRQVRGLIEATFSSSPLLFLPFLLLHLYFLSDPFIFDPSPSLLSIPILLSLSLSFPSLFQEALDLVAETLKKMSRSSSKESEELCVKTLKDTEGILGAADAQRMLVCTCPFLYSCLLRVPPPPPSPSFSSLLHLPCPPSSLASIPPILQVQSSVQYLARVFLSRPPDL